MWPFFFFNLTQPLSFPPPTFRKLKIFFSMVTDPKWLLPQQPPQLAGCLRGSLRKGNTLLTIGGRATEEAKHHNHLPLAGDTISAKRTEGKLAKTVLEKVFLPNILIVRDTQKETSFLH